jgi:hypothetical protein
MPPLDESWQGGAEPIDTHPRCSFEAQAVAHATRSPLSPRTKGGTPALNGYGGERVAAAFSPMRQRYGKRSAPADACSSPLAGVWIGPSVMLAYTHAKRTDGCVRDSSAISAGGLATHGVIS